MLKLVNTEPTRTEPTQAEWEETLRERDNEDQAQEAWVQLFRITKQLEAMDWGAYTGSSLSRAFVAAGIKKSEADALKRLVQKLYKVEAVLKTETKFSTEPGAV